MTGVISTAAMLLGFASAAFAQTSSLYVQPATVAQTSAPVFGPAPQATTLAPAVREFSFTAVAAAEPRRFAVHDLVTIIIREFSEGNSQSSLETQKDAKWDGKISEFPHLTLSDLIDLQLKPGASEPVSLGIKYGQEWEGEGKYKRKDTVSDRITARIIDVKPNGLLVLEARRELKQDKEEQMIVLTGTCRAEDVSIDNTVLSTQLYDLRLDKQHKGELRKTTRKGIVTRILEGIFNF